MSTVSNHRSCHWAEAALTAPFRALVSWYRVAQERTEMRSLPSERLSDMGLTRRDIENEIRRPFWQVSRDD